MMTPIEQAIKAHDKYQIEVKLDYQLRDDEKTRYKVSTYIFIPQSLGINESTYSKSDFYRDIQNYLRLKTPVLILRDFTSHPKSPLVTVEKIITIPGWTNEAGYKDRLIDNFKLLSAMLKSSIRDHLNLIHRRVEEAPPDSKVNLFIHNLVEEFLIETGRITAKYRSFYTAFNLPNVDKQVFNAYKFIDESISLLVEESSIEMFQIVEDYLKKSDRAGFKEKLVNRVAEETGHRKALGYPSLLHETGDNEEYTYRLSVLKKYASSTLYLSTAVHREGANLEHVVYALAAGLAMVFATVVAFYFQQRYGNFTFPFFMALVVGYMFKDRIKETTKSLFAKYLQNVLYDRQTTIRTLDGQHKLGVLREKVSFIREKDVPPRIVAARNKDAFSELDNSGQGETVIRYTKNITLFTDIFKQKFVDMPEITGLNDIMRYNIRTYLRKMDEPVEERYYPEDGRLKTIITHRVYHINLVFKYTSKHLQTEKMYRRIRLILNRAGIKRLEQVEL